ncbi:D-serine ammonia-lyase [Desulfuribacillus stibiiarsenatis]|nr:D-serine ammonia-lyase [Desulfuribacillus stibiiarsenatis]
MIHGKTLEEWLAMYPMLEEVIDAKEVFWNNPSYTSYQEAIQNIRISEDEVRDAAARLERFAPYLMEAFPETSKNRGVIESPLIEVPSMHADLNNSYKAQLTGKLLLKCDNQLAISGSIKARGGIYEVLKHSETLAIENYLLTLEDDYAMMNSDRFREFYSQYSIAVGSTGNLGLSIGIMGAQIGFQVFVHMSADAKQWKKDLLRDKGVTVIEYDADYSQAVAAGRKQAESNAKMFFIDDENSKDLFLGYAVAAYRLQEQLKDKGYLVDHDHPLFAYLPCGVGGGPGGIAFGLKLIFGDDVHCFFAEPTHSPCMLLGLLTGLHEQVSVQDFNLDNITAADGLAVGRPSGFIGRTLEQMISGVYTVTDEKLFLLLKKLVDTENISLEPSALTGLAGPTMLLRSKMGQEYIAQHNLQEKMHQAIHLPWATGGNMVPFEVMEEYYTNASKIQRKLNFKRDDSTSDSNEKQCSVKAKYYIMVLFNGGAL